MAITKCSVSSDTRNHSMQKSGHGKEKRMKKYDKPVFVILCRSMYSLDYAYICMYDIVCGSFLLHNYV